MIFEQRVQELNDEKHLIVLFKLVESILKRWKNLVLRSSNNVLIKTKFEKNTEKWFEVRILEK